MQQDFRDTKMGSKQIFTYLMAVVPYFSRLPMTSAFSSSKISTMGFFSVSPPFFCSS